MVYAGQKALFAEASRRGNRAKSYLVNVRKLPIDKVIAIDGYRECSQFNYSFAPKDFAPPIPLPTLDPGQVEIVYEKKRHSRK